MIYKSTGAKAYGPLQIVHDFKFVALNVMDDYSILDRLDHRGKVEYIKARIDKLCRMGYGGVVMNVDYNNYLKDPSAFELFFECAEYVKEKGMRVWIYDEQYYPSGAAGGLTLAGHPELEALALVCVSGNFSVDETVGAVRVASPLGHSELKYAFAAPIVDGTVDHSHRTDISACKDLGGGLAFDAPVGEWRVWCFFLRPLYELTKFCDGTRASRRYINVFNKAAVERFYKVTFEDGYLSHIKGKLGDVVDAIFTDEPYSPFYSRYHHDYGETKRTQMPSCSIYDKPHRGVEIYPYVPWEMSVVDRYKERYGRSIIDTLPDLFDETPATKAARIDFYTLMSDMSKEAFPEQMAQKLAEEGVLFSGHYYGEEGLDFHPIFYGDVIDHLGVMGIPGCDCLWSDLDVLRYSMACKVASSAAHVNCRDEAMIEASNMVDKDQAITLHRLKAAVSVMFAHGINRITSYYGENLLCESEMREFADYVTALTDLFNGGKYRVNTLVYYPFENLCADRTPMGIREGTFVGEDHLGVGSASAELMKHRVYFDLINKKKLLTCRVGDECLIAPNGEKIYHVVLPAVAWLDEEVESLLLKAKSAGVEIIYGGEKDGKCNAWFTEKRICDGCLPKTELTLAEANPYILAMYRAFDEYDLFMLVNTDKTDHSLDVELDVTEGEEVCLVDPLTLNRTSIHAKTVDGKAHFTLQIPALASVIVGRI